jgi:glucose-6-phosphate 1-dehydrogenase
MTKVLTVGQALDQVDCAIDFYTAVIAKPGQNRFNVIGAARAITSIASIREYVSDNISHLESETFEHHDLEELAEKEAKVWRGVRSEKECEEIEQAALELWEKVYNFHQAVWYAVS